jgi:Xaa-Pro aminopeptidase
MSEPPKKSTSAVIIAGIPAENMALYHRTRFAVCDPAVWLEIPAANGRRASTFIVRDVEFDRAQAAVRADTIATPAMFTPAAGLSGDRATATAQAAAECLKRAGVKQVRADRTLSLIFAEHLRLAGIEVEYDADLGVSERRTKDDQELAALRASQKITEGAMQMACRLVAQARPRWDGVLTVDGEPLTSERVRAAISVWLLEHGYSNPACIVAGGAQSADCHALGSGNLSTGQPVIIDIFPRCRTTLYWGDCTRTVVHGDVPDELAKMHSAVVAAKAAATAVCRAGVSGEEVHRATVAAIESHGYEFSRPGEAVQGDRATLPHGTGHGVGLEVHEPPLLDIGGPPLVAGDVVTIEPGLYAKDLGGVRVEDMLAITANGCESFNSLPEGLDWSGE